MQSMHFKSRLLQIKGVDNILQKMRTLSYECEFQACLCDVSMFTVSERQSVMGKLAVI